MTLHRFIIEREMPGASTLEREQIRAGVSKSKDVMRQLGPDIQWMHSYVTDNGTFCVYLAKDEAIIRKHAEIADIPVTRIVRVRTIADHTT
jgi:Protein of unknown function (DUF4242)